MSREAAFMRDVYQHMNSSEEQEVYRKLGVPVGSSVTVGSFAYASRGVGRWEFGAAVAIAYNKYRKSF